LHRQLPVVALMTVPICFAAGAGRARFSNRARSTTNAVDI